MHQICDQNEDRFTSAMFDEISTKTFCYTKTHLLSTNNFTNLLLTNSAWISLVFLFPIWIFIFPQLAKRGFIKIRLIICLEDMTLYLKNIYYYKCFSNLKLILYNTSHKEILSCMKIQEWKTKILFSIPKICTLFKLWFWQNDWLWLKLFCKHRNCLHMNQKLCLVLKLLTVM